MWDQEFEGVVRRHLPFLAADESLEADASLRDLGLDSLAAVELLSELESTFGVRFENDALTLATFESPAVLWQAFSAIPRPAG